MTLMEQLGYERYGAHGNDVGSQISPEVGRHAPERVVGVHVTQLFSFPSGDPTEFDGLSDEDQAALGFLKQFTSGGGLAYNQYQSAQPQTLTGTIGSSIRRYYEDAHASGRPSEPTTTPTGVAIFAQDFQSVRRFSERDHANIVSWNRYPSGSHFATRDATDLLISDIRGFYRALR